MDQVTDQKPSLELSRRFDAAPERVFAAWITPAWAEWLPPAGLKCEAVAMEPRVGGRYDLRMTHPDGRVVNIFGEYREIIPARRLVLSWNGSYNNNETILTVTFEPDGTGTRMTLTQTGFADPSFRDRHNEGWSGPGGSFDKLAKILGA